MDRHDDRDAVRPRHLIELADRVRSLLESDPRAAVEFVSNLEADSTVGVSEKDLASIRAGIFIDGGADLNEPSLINDGILILERLLEDSPGNLHLRYNLGNGYSALAQNLYDEERPWFLLTSEPRHFARSHFSDVVIGSSERGLQGRALTNHANLLEQSYRWVEAFESYRAAVQTDPRNGVASSGAAKLLLKAADRGLGEPQILRSLARQYVEAARTAKDQIGEYSSKAEDAIGSLPSIESLPDLDASARDLEPYARFVTEERLALSLTVQGLGDDLKRWDSLAIGHISEPIESSSGVPPTFAALNVLKADFLAVRWLLFEALHEPPRETGRYTDTLDYASYGVEQSMLVLAQKAAVDLLDKVAVAVTEYLSLEDAPTSVDFRSRWHVKRKKDQAVKWQPWMEREVRSGTTALIALSELAEDLEMGGPYHRNLRTRHAGTHRLVVLHDMGTEPSRPSRYLEHRNETEFSRLARDSLRAARAAILYFVLAVGQREHRLAEEHEGAVGTILAPSHEYIRGEDE